MTIQTHCVDENHCLGVWGFDRNSPILSRSARDSNCSVCHTIATPTFRGPASLVLTGDHSKVRRAQLRHLVWLIMVFLS